MKRSLVCAIAILCVAALAALTQQPSGTQSQGSSGSQPRVNIPTRPSRPTTPEAGAERRAPNISVTTTTVLINVTVLTPLGQSVTSLEKEHFKLWEDKAEQNILTVSSEEAPLSVGLVFDVSGSMNSKMAKARQAAAEFFRTSNPDDEFFLVQFNDRPELTVKFTSRTEEIQTRLAFTQAKGRTALLDGLHLAMHEMKNARHPRKAILVLSDGGDNSSRYTQSEIKNLVREADVQIYAMGIFERAGGMVPGGAPELMMGPGLLSDIAEQTGGRHFPVENIGYLPDITSKIGIELRSQYVLSYSPTNGAKDGKYRKVDVKVPPIRGVPQLRVYHRQGYFAPVQ